MAAGQGPIDRRAGVSEVSKTFGTHRVLTSVSLTFTSGKVLGLAGHNGSGKSTLIKCLAGYYQPDPGADLVVEGERLPWESLAQSWSSRLSFVHQDLGLVGDLNAVENFALVNGFARQGKIKIDWRRQVQATNDALARLGVSIDTRVAVSSLPAVDRTMLAVARAFARMPADGGVLVLDEPTAALTAHEATPLFDSIRRATEHGASVVLVTHHLDEIMDHTDDVVVLREGHVVLEAPTTELTRSMLAGAVAPESATIQVRQSTVNADAPPVLVVQDLAGPRLEPLSLRVLPGQIVGIGGLSGSGRDDVAALISGHVPRVGGRITIDGAETRIETPRSASRAGIAHAPANRQALALFP